MMLVDGLDIEDWILEIYKHATSLEIHNIE